MFTFAQWIARLSKGYLKATGKKPDGLAKIKIQMEAAQRVKDQNKVVPFRYKKSFKQELDEMKPTTVEDFIKKDDWDPSGMASGGRIGMGIGGFTKAQVLIQMLKNTIKGSKDPYVKKNFPNFIKEIQKNPELALDENVWKQFTTGLPKNQRLIVHSDDSVDFFTQSKFGPHNIEKTLEFQKKHNLSRDQANKILRMEPEDRVLEMTRLEKMSRGKPHASGGIAGQLHLNEGGRIGLKDGTKFSPSKRKFLKGAGAGLAALSALPFVGKFFKPAAKAVSKAAKVTKFPDGEPKYLADLIAVVKAKGKTSPAGYQDAASVHRYKNVEVVEEAGGITKIKHEKEFDVGHEYPGYRENQMELTKVDEMVDPESGQSFYRKEGMGDELHSYEALETEKYTNAKLYDEGTLRPDPNDPGKFVDDLDAISEADHLELKKIADEAKDLAIKKASGGLAGQLHLNQGGRIGFKEGKGHPTTGKGLYELVTSTNYKPTAMEQILIDEYLGIPATYASGGLSHILNV